MTTIKQNSKSDCLWASMKMLLANINKDNDYLYLKNEKETPYSFLEIVKEAEKHNMYLEGFECTDLNDFDEIKTPFIATLNEGKNKHAVVVESFKNEKIEYVDPAIGYQKIDYEDFIKIWDKKGLFIKDFIRTKCDKSEIIKVDKKMMIPPILSQLITNITLLFGTFAISDEFPIYIPIIIFSLFVIFQILSRKLIIDAMKKFDEENLYTKQFKNNFEFVYTSYNNLKMLYFKIPLVIMNSITLIVFIIALLLSNSWINIVYLLLPIFFIIIKQFNTRKDFEGNSIMKMESQLFKYKNNDSFIDMCRLINEKSYSYVNNKKILDYVIYGLYIFAVIIIMGVTNNISINYMIFNIASIFFIDNQVNQLFDIKNNISEFRNNKSYFIDSVKN